MITLRPGHERGRTRLPWLDSRHSFSFGNYHDPDRMGFRTLRVINEDHVAPAGGFPPHPHRDMEIVTYVVSGALQHKDSMGNGEVIQAGDVQRMTAGSGIEHSEFNASRKEPVHFLQIWLLPEKRGLTPEYEQRNFPAEARRGRLCPIVSPDGREGALTLHQDALLFATALEPGEEVVHTLRPGRHAWLQVMQGEVDLNGRRLAAGDGAAISEEEALTIIASTSSEALLFDLA